MLLVTWDSVLVGVSLIVAFIAAFTALDTAGRVAVSHGWMTRLWLLAGGMAMGIGIWAMHFIGMLAMMMPMRYDVSLTVLSLLAACAACMLAFAQTQHGRFSRRRWLAGSAMLGSGIVAMHYIGMLALLISPAPHWRFSLVALSVAIAYLASGAALWLAFHLRQGEKYLLTMRALGALVMGVAIAGMHYTGMAAAQFDRHSMPLAQGVSGQGLAVWVALGTLSILGFTLLASMLDAQLRAARLAQRLNQANQELHQLAMHDNLTALPNRVMLEQRLDVALSQTTRDTPGFTLMYMDLDGFKAVNDTWGHYVGDRLLIAVADRLRRQLSDDKILLARLGGDEFALLMPECALSQGCEVVQRIVTAVNSYAFSWQGGTYQVGASAGLTQIAADNGVGAEVLSQADIACYNAKKAGRGQLMVYTPPAR